MDKEQYIQKYIANKLSNADKQAFEKLLETDSDFKLAFEKHNDVSMAFKLAEARSLKAKFQKLENDNTSDANKKSGFSKAWYLAIASVLVIGFFLTINNISSGEELYNSHFSVYPNTYQPITRGNTESMSLEAFEAYENNDFERAQIAFESLLKTENNPNIQFYYALSLLYQSKYDSALAQFMQLNKTKYEYSSESIWYTALIYLNKEDFKNAKAQLENLDSLNSSFKSDERKKLLQELEDF